MSKNKSKIVKWEYVTKPFDVLVHPATVKRVHSLLARSLSSFYPKEKLYLHLRPCVQCLDEYGAVVKYLYCTRDGRFFVRGRNGWNEVKPEYAPNRPSAKDGRCHSTYPQMIHFGAKLCHLCIAHAWLGARPEGKVCDHLDTNLLNLNADNLQWVTVAENRRRAKIAKRMRKAAIDPKILTPTLLRGIFGLPEEYFEEFVGQYLLACKECSGPIDIHPIRTCVAIALDNIRIQMDESEITY